MKLADRRTTVSYQQWPKEMLLPERGESPVNCYYFNSQICPRPWPFGFGDLFDITQPKDHIRKV